MEHKLKNLNCIGILGGTFNPVHKGHSMLAREVINQFPHIEQLFIMPNNIPAYKEADNIISSQHRINMLNLAMFDIEKTYISDMEIRRGGNTYTIDTLNTIKAINKNINIYFIIGADSLYNIEKWRQYKDIFQQCTLIAAKRECEFSDIKNFSRELKLKYPYFSIEFLKTKGINISSSYLREQIKAGVFDENYIDINVINYIKNNKLYGWNNIYESRKNDITT